MLQRHLLNVHTQNKYLRPTGTLFIRLIGTLVVQAFYRLKDVNLLLIATEGFLTPFGPGTCPL